MRRDPSSNKNPSMFCKQKAARLIAVASVIALSCINWRTSSNGLKLLQLAYNDLSYDNHAKSPANIDANIDAITDHFEDFPQFMLQWPIDTYEDDPNQCNNFDKSLPHTLTFTNSPKSYRLEDVLLFMRGNLTALWNQGGAATNENSGIDSLESGGAAANVSVDVATTQIKTVTCRMSDRGLAHHFPHLMQNIFPCFSLWRRFPNAHHILDKTERFDEWFFHTAPLIRGMMDVLRASNVTIIRSSANESVEETNSSQVEDIVARGNIITEHADAIKYGGYRMVQEDDMYHVKRLTMSALGLSNVTDQACGSTALHAASRRIPRIAVSNRNGTRRLLGA
eukprot:CAMPEP_0198111490 /NCGR_PEP_ID=MMETSP1442-20131203/3458_1 /TAXON_ID= /ORGANISM="Craspedostauros australis, Strain CCMP3328" /LENGTH=337 /DNA_ID=CAMNT_0043767947 /DNA_START=82 /DNA_END=1091 /DNA_ORIENTATION=-